MHIIIASTQFQSLFGLIDMDDLEPNKLCSYRCMFINRLKPTGMHLEAMCELDCE